MGQESFKIGATLQLKGNAASDLEKLRLVVLKTSEAFTALNERMKILNGQFLNLGTIVKRLNPSLNVFTSQLGLTTTEFKGANASITGFNTRLSYSAARVDRLTASTAALKDELSGLSVASNAAGMGLIGGRGGRRGGGHGDSPLRVHSKSFEFAGLGLGFAPGYAAAAIGGYATYESYNEAKKYQQAQAQFAQLNLGDNANKTADEYAKNLKLVGVSQIEALETLRDSTVVMGDLAHGMEIAPLISKMQFANSALFADTNIKIGRNQYQDLIRVIEMRGGFTSPAEMAKQSNYMQKVISGTGGLVLPTQYRNLMQTGGVAAQHLSDEAFYFKLEPLIQEMGGFRVGTSLMSLYQAVQAGKMTTAAAIRWNELGLIKPGMAQFNKIGMIKRIKPGGVKGGDLEGNDPLEWLYDVYFPALRAHGITSEGDTLREIATDYTNRTAANFVSKAYLQQVKIAKNVAISQKSKDINATNKASQDSAAGHEIALKAALTDLGVAFGKLTMPSVIGGMTALTKFVIGLTDIIKLFNGDASKSFTPSEIKSFKDQFNVKDDASPIKKANTISPVKSQAVQLHGTVTLDKQKVGTILTDHITHTANSVPNNTARFDSGMSPTPVLLKQGLY